MNKQYYENKLHKLICQLEQSYGELIGIPSIHRLEKFISGYIYCVWDLTGLYLKFDREFQSYVEKVMNNHEAHWANIIASAATEEEAFRSFFSIYHQFVKETGFGGNGL